MKQQTKSVVWVRMWGCGCALIDCTCTKCQVTVSGVEVFMGVGVRGCVCVQSSVSHVVCVCVLMENGVWGKLYRCRHDKMIIFMCSGHVHVQLYFWSGCFRSSASASHTQHRHSHTTSHPSQHCVTYLHMKYPNSTNHLCQGCSGLSTKGCYGCRFTFQPSIGLTWFH